MIVGLNYISYLTEGGETIEITLQDWLKDNPFGNIHGLWINASFAVYADGQGQLWLIRRPSLRPGNSDIYLVTIATMQGDPLLTKAGTVMWLPI